MRRIERRLAVGQSVTQALKPDLARVSKSDWKQIHRATNLDWQECKSGQTSLLGQLLSVTLEELAAAKPVDGLPAGQQGLDVRPVFRHSSPLVISYETSSDGVFAKQTAAQLRVLGKDCWTANTSLRGGAQWNREIYRRIEGCAELIVVVSQASIDSEFVAAEVQFAFKCGKRVIALHLEPNLKPEWLDLRLGTVHAIMWFDNPSAFDELLLALQP